MTGLNRRMKKALGWAPEAATKRSSIVKMGGTPMMKGGKRDTTASSDSSVGAGKDGAGATNKNVVKTSGDGNGDNSSGDGNGSSGDGNGPAGVPLNNFKDVVTPFVAEEGQGGSSIGAAGITDPTTDTIEKDTDQTSSGSSTTAANSANGVIGSAQDSSNILSDPSPLVDPTNAVLGSTDDASSDDKSSNNGPSGTVVNSANAVLGSSDKSSNNGPSGTVVNSANAVLGSSSDSSDDSSNNSPSGSVVPNSASAFLGSPNRASRVSPQASVVDSTEAIMGSSDDSGDSSNDNSGSTVVNSASAVLASSDDSPSNNSGSSGNDINPTGIDPTKQVLGSAPSTGSLTNVLGSSVNDNSNGAGIDSLPSSGLPVSSDDLVDGPIQDNGSDASNASKDTEGDALDAGTGVLSEANGQDLIDSPSSTLLGSEDSSYLLPEPVNPKQIMGESLDAVTGPVSEGCPLSAALRSSMSNNLVSIVANTASIVQSTSVADLNTDLNAMFPYSAALYADVLSAHDETKASSDDSNLVDVVGNTALPTNTDALGLGGLLEAVKDVVKATLNLQSSTSGLTDALLQSGLSYLNTLCAFAHDSLFL